MVRTKLIPVSDELHKFLLLKKAKEGYPNINAILEEVLFKNKK